MKLHVFYKTLKNQGSIKIVKPSIQVEFMYQKEGKVMMTIALKAGINKILTKEFGFEMHKWHEVVDILTTATAWEIYNNLTKTEKTNVVLKQPDHELWLEEDEI